MTFKKLCIILPYLRTIIFLAILYLAYLPNLFAQTVPITFEDIVLERPTYDSFFDISDNIQLQENNHISKKTEIEAENDLVSKNINNSKETKFQWKSALAQSLMFLEIQHAFRFITEPSTRAEIKGPFFKDYFKSVRNLRGWEDGDSQLVNYVGHPMMGAVTGYIQIHNDPKGINQQVSFKKGYLISRLKAMTWSAIYSTQFEIGPISEASLGNVGKEPSNRSNHPMAYVDLVITPTIGTATIVCEDLIDKYIVCAIERKTTNRVARILARGCLNPNRSFANILRFKWMWHRDNRQL